MIKKISALGQFLSQEMYLSALPQNHATLLGALGNQFEVKKLILLATRVVNNFEREVYQHRPKEYQKVIFVYHVVFVISCTKKLF